MIQTYMANKSLHPLLQNTRSREDSLKLKKKKSDGVFWTACYWQRSHETPYTYAHTHTFSVVRQMAEICGRMGDSCKAVKKECEYNQEKNKKKIE